MATVIKSSEFHAQANAHPFNLLDIEEEASRILASAREQAEADRARILSEAKAHAAKMEAEARSRGFREGREKGLAEGTQAGHEQAFAQASEQFASQQAGLTEACRNIVYAFDEHKNRLLLAARTDMVRLALAVVRRVVKRVEADPAMAESACIAHAAEMLDLVGPKTDPVLHVNPQVLEAMATFAAQLAESTQSSRHVRVVADETVPPGGCVLKTAEGSVDATLETQVDRIAELLLGETKPAPGASGRERESDGGR
jgi:flagellar assembly protein FliH